VGMTAVLTVSFVISRF